MGTAGLQDPPAIESLMGSANATGPQRRGEGSQSVGALLFGRQADQSLKTYGFTRSKEVIDQLNLDMNKEPWTEIPKTYYEDEKAGANMIIVKFASEKSLRSQQTMLWTTWRHQMMSLP